MNKTEQAVAMLQGMIERYITRIERERTARNSGLVD